MRLLTSPIPVLLVALLVVAACDSVEPQPEPREPLRALTAAEQEVVRADNRFGLRLFQAVTADEQDATVVVSPLSVSMALGMTLNGAADSTYRAMAATLGKAGLTEEAVNQSYRSLIDLLRGLDPKVAFEIANSIWHEETFTVEQPFLDVNRTYFDAEVRGLDFGDPAAVHTINAWVEQATQGKIETILDRIPPDVVMYLVNALYFRGDWTYRFDEADTRDQPFHAADGSTTPVPMMHQEAALPYVHTDRYAAVDLPYGDSLYSMTVVLPDADVPIDQLVADLDADAWHGLTAGLRSRDVHVYLPRFKIEYETELRQALTALGMGVAFSPQADFSRINPDAPLAISGVLHKTFVEVDERGTEAAAVTAVGIELTSLPQTPTLRADRPFLFFIRERHSGSILFAGKVMDV